MDDLERKLQEKDADVKTLKEKIEQSRNSLAQVQSETKLQIEDLQTHLANECQKNEENLKNKGK